MIVTGLSHDCQMIVTWLSHDCHDCHTHGDCLPWASWLPWTPWGVFKWWYVVSLSISRIQIIWKCDRGSNEKCDDFSHGSDDECDNFGMLLGDEITASPLRDFLRKCNSYWFGTQLTRWTVTLDNYWIPDHRVAEFQRLFTLKLTWVDEMSFEGELLISLAHRKTYFWKWPKIINLQDEILAKCNKRRKLSVAAT